MSDFEKELRGEVNKVGQQPIPWFKHPVPLWAAGVAFLVGALVGRFA